MAFYGRITNESKTSMTFDRIYPNRLTMLANADSDGVFNGRFVLVEYDTAPAADDNSYPEGYAHAYNLIYSRAVQYIENTDYYTYNSESGEYTITDEVDDSTDFEEHVYYIIDNANYYQANYNIDKLEYPRLGRGYDSTVWRKVINADGEHSYVMLAELNSVVPTFDIKTLPPSNKPQAPKFSDDSSNVYYQLEIGSTWGVQVNEPNINKDGFIVKESHHSGAAVSDNKISIEEGKGPPPHKTYGPSYDQQEANDTKIVTINLPGIGDMVATGYDKIYGEDRDREVKWLNGSEAEKDLHVGHLVEDQLIEDQPGEIEYSQYVPEKFNNDYNIADAIRSTYDIMGMIIEPISIEQYTDLDINKPTSATSPGYIYYVDCSDSDIDDSEFLTEEQKQELKQNRFFYYGYKFGFSDDDEIDLANSQKPCKIVNSVEAFPTTAAELDKIYRINTASIGADTLYVKNKSNEAVKDKIYCKIDASNYFTDEYKVNGEHLINAFEALQENSELYKKAKNNNEIKLIKVLPDEEIDSTTYDYYYIPNKETNRTEIDNVAIFSAKHNEGRRDTFCDDKGNAYTEQIFRTLEDGTPVYYKEPEEEIYDPVTRTWSRTYRYHQVGVKWTEPENYINGLDHIAPWPADNAKTLENSDNNELWNPDLEESTQGRHFWLKRLEPTGEVDSGNNPIYVETFTLEAYRPALTYDRWGEDDEHAAKSITGNVLSGKGYGPRINLIGSKVTEDDDNATEEEINTNPILYKLTGIQSVAQIENFWVYRDDIIYFCNTLDDLRDAEDKDYIYKLDDEWQNIATEMIDENDDSYYLLYGINGSVWPDPVDYHYYFVPHEVYYEDSPSEYIIADTFQAETDYYKMLDLCVKQDYTDPEHPFSKFRSGERWNLNLDLDEINSNKPLASSVDGLEFDENYTHYYTKQNDEYVLVTTPIEENFATYYIDPVVLGYKVAIPALLPLSGYARDLNTINGIILAMNRLFGADDPNSRDTSTIEGMLNTLEDKLKNLSDIPGNSLVVTDEYGHLSGATITDQNGAGQDRAIITDPIEENEITGLEPYYPDLYNAEDDSTYYYVGTDSQNNYYQYFNGTDTISVPTVTTGPNSWLTADVVTSTDGNTYAYILHNTVNVDTATASASDLNNGTDTITLKDIEYDAAGHIIGVHDHEYTLPYGFNTINIDGTNIVADTTHDAITLKGDDWVAITPGSFLETSFTLSAGTILNQANSSTLYTDELELANDASGKNISIRYNWTCTGTDLVTSDLMLLLNFKVNNLWREFTWNDGVNTQTNGHYANTVPTLSGTQTIVTTVPENATQVRIGIYNNAASAPAQVTIGGSVITNNVLKAEKIIRFTHSGPVTTTHTVVADATPKFGESFAITDYDFDTTGHKANSGTHSITIPAITFSDASTASDGYSVITGLSFDSTTGEIVIERDPVGARTLSDYSSTTTTTSIGDGTTIATAIKSLESRIDVLESFNGAAAGSWSQAATDSNNGLALALTLSTDSSNSSIAGSIDTSILAPTIGSTTLPAIGGQNVLTTSAQTLIGAINELQQGVVAAGAYSYANNAYIFRQFNAPTVDDSPVTNPKTIYSGWIWIKTSSDGTESLNNEIYFCTTTTTGTVNWELLNSWR